MKGVSDDVESAQFHIGDGDACRIGMAILDGRHLQSFFSGGRGDQFNDGFQRRLWFGPQARWK